MLLASFDAGQDALRTITTQRAGLQRTAEEAAALHARLDVALVSFSETRSPEVGLAAAGVAEIQVGFIVHGLGLRVHGYEFGAPRTTYSRPEPS